MSYEGYEEYLCTKGHYLTVSCYDNTPLTCQEIGCHEKFEWHHSVDETNGYDEEDDSSFSANVVEIGWDDTPMKDHYGNQYFSKISRYAPAPNSAWRKMRPDRHSLAGCIFTKECSGETYYCNIPKSLPASVKMVGQPLTQDMVLKQIKQTMMVCSSKDYSDRFTHAYPTEPEVMVSFQCVENGPWICVDRKAYREWMRGLPKDVDQSIRDLFYSMTDAITKTHLDF